MTVLLGVAAGNHIVAFGKAEAWTEVTTPHFIVMSDDGEKTARRVADQFEQIRRLYSKALTGTLRFDPGIPIIVIAVKNEKLLSEVIPEYWAQKGSVHPAGLFVPGPEKNYIAVRTNTVGDVPYVVIYHEYVHLIVNLNFQHFALWLNEGLADYLGNATLAPNGGAFGRMDLSYLNLLSQTKLLPLDVLFSVDQRSEYYDEASKANVFYAESWALVHFFMTDPDKRQANLIGKYVNALENGGDRVESARMLFGDLGQLRQQLQAYLTRTTYQEYAVTFSEPPTSANYTVRELSLAEAEERLGDFDLYRGQLDRARPKIEEAMRLSPMLAEVQESMGLLLFQQGKRLEAKQYLARALALNPNSAYANFLDGMLLLSLGDDEESLAAAQKLLEKAVVVNPLFAPAWDNLGMLYSRDTGTLNEALGAFRNAVKAMPGEPSYQLDEAKLLITMRRFDDARTIAEVVKRSADQAVSSRAERVLFQIDQLNAAASSPDKYHGEGVDPFARSAGYAGPLDLNPNLKRRGIGTIVAVDCSQVPAITITFREGDSLKHLHFPSLSMIDIQVEPRKYVPDNMTCSDLIDKKAGVLYHLASNQPWDGEVEFIDLIEAQ